jgi:ribosomal protein L24
MGICKTIVTAMTISSLLCVAGWAQRGRGPEGSRDRREGPEFRERHVVPHLPGGARHIFIGGRPYWVSGGVYYEFGDDGYVVVGAPVVRVLPSHCRVVVIDGVAYYVDDDVYYRSTSDGYIVVERPVEPAKVVVAAPEGEASKVTLYVPKKDADGFTPVILKKVGGGFLGPQGEFYPTMPRVSLLTEMYGIPEILRQTSPDIYFIHVPNKDGQSFTRVELTRHNGGFLGPQGEFYPIMPSVAHLAEMYGGANQSAKAADAATAPVAQAPVKVDDSTIHVQVHKKNGQGTVDVVLKKRDQGYVGPQGEFYPEMPSVSQLTEVYGAE